jgi:hypothetical protein
MWASNADMLDQNDYIDKLKPIEKISGDESKDLNKLGLSCAKLRFS